MVAMAQHLFERVEHWWVDRVLAIARGTLARAEKGFSDWRARQRQMHELAGFSPHEIDLLARDVGVRSGDELAQLVRAGPHGAELLPKMAKLLGAGLCAGRTFLVQVADTSRAVRAFLLPRNAEGVWSLLELEVRVRRKRD